MTRRFLQLLRSEHAGSAAEFSLVLPVLVALMLGMVDVGRFMWDMNRAEKATQIGARMAVVTNPVSTGLVNANFESPGTLAAGDLIPASALGTLTCSSTTCSCTQDPCTGIASTVNTTAFTAIVTRMAQIMPEITADNVNISYRGSGFGFAGGNAGTMEISPLVTVSLHDVKFRPITTVLQSTMTLPSFATTLTAEDSSGQYSN